MLKLYQSSDFPIISNWVTDAELLLQYAGTLFTYPITEAQLIEHQKRNPDNQFYLCYLPEGVPFAFGEIVLQENGRPRLSRILIGDKNLRGKGWGQYFINLLIQECRKTYQPDYIDLYVWDKNTAAIKCYERVGFKLNKEKFNTLKFNDAEYDIYKMTNFLR